MIDALIRFFTPIFHTWAMLLEQYDSVHTLSVMGVSMGTGFLLGGLILLVFDWLLPDVDTKPDKSPDSTEWTRERYP